MCPSTLIACNCRRRRLVASGGDTRVNVTSLHSLHCFRPRLLLHLRYRPLRNLAITLIQKCYRAKRDRRLAKAYKSLIKAAATKVSPHTRYPSFERGIGG